MASQQDALATTAELVAALQTKLRADLIETHISWVLLDGHLAWKIKKPVHLSFLDATALGTRRQLCEDELRLNQRLARDLYVDVVPIFGTPSAPHPAVTGDGDGDGEPIEYALRMRQFAAGALFKERLLAGTLEPHQLDQLARRLVVFHRDSAKATTDSPYATPELIESATTNALEGLALHGCQTECAVLRPWLQAQSSQLQDLWTQRKAGCKVVEGHGDLHLANIVVLGGDVTAFDCIEFDPALRWIDICNDIAFLVMDLLGHGRADLGYRFLNAYLDESGDHACLPTLLYYMVYRALVRALVARIRVTQGGVADQPDYLALAMRLIQPHDPRLLITHGLSGSGKSYVSQRLLELAPAIRLRSDVERKRLFGLHALESSARLGTETIYSTEATRRTFARLHDLAAMALSAGYSVIVDAAFLRRSERDAFHQLAVEQRVPFTILHCCAPVAALRERVSIRQTRHDDASEAGLSVLEHQLHFTEALEPDELAHAIQVNTEKDEPANFGAIADRWAACLPSI